MVACEFFVVITAAFRTLYVFVVIEIGSRQILGNHPKASGLCSASGSRPNALQPRMLASQIRDYLKPR